MWCFISTIYAGVVNCESSYSLLEEILSLDFDTIFLTLQKKSFAKNLSVYSSAVRRSLRLGTSLFHVPELSDSANECSLFRVSLSVIR